PAPEYREHMNKEGQAIPANQQWNESNGTYPVSYGLGTAMKRLYIRAGTLDRFGMAMLRLGLAVVLIWKLWTLMTLFLLLENMRIDLTRTSSHPAHAAMQATCHPETAEKETE